MEKRNQPIDDSNKIDVSAPDVAGVFAGPGADESATVDTGFVRGRGKVAVKTTRPPNPIDSLVADHTPYSNQEKFVARGRIVPEALQPRMLDKRINNLKLPANFSK